MSDNKDKSVLQVLRKNVHKTQDQVAEYMNVTPNTIQNWEGNPSQIKDEQLCKLLSFYNIKQEEEIKKIFWKIHKDNFGINGNKAYNFPDFLLADYPEVIETARNLELSAKEMELFGYMYHIELIRNSKISFDDRFFEKHGGYFATMSKMKIIRERVGKIVNREGLEKSISDIIYDYGVEYLGKGFSFCSLSKKTIVQSLHKLSFDNNENMDIHELYEYCKKAEKSIFIGTTKEKCYDLEVCELENYLFSCNSISHWNNSDSYDYELKRKGIYEKCFQIEKREFTDESYLKEKVEYEESLNEYKKHPSLYDHAPRNFTPQYEYWLSLTDLGKQYVAWTEEDSKN